MIKYRIEIYDPKRRRYNVSWQGRSLYWALRMMNKSYMARSRRRLVRVEKTVVHNSAAGQCILFVQE